MGGSEGCSRREERGRGRKGKEGVVRRMGRREGVHRRKGREGRH